MGFGLIVVGHLCFWHTNDGFRVWDVVRECRGRAMPAFANPELLLVDDDQCFFSGVDMWHLVPVATEIIVLGHLDLGGQPAPRVLARPIEQIRPHRYEAGEPPCVFDGVHRDIIDLPSFEPEFCCACELSVRVVFDYAWARLSGGRCGIHERTVV